MENKSNFNISSCGLDDSFKELSRQLEIETKSIANRIAKQTSINMNKELATAMVQNNDFDSSNYELIKWDESDYKTMRFNICFKVLYKKSSHYSRDLNAIMDHVRTMNESKAMNESGTGNTNLSKTFPSL